MEEEKKDELLEKVAIKYQDLITKSYDDLAKNVFNVSEHRLEMKTEAVIRSAYFRATRRYAQWITKKEGRNVEELDVKGLEFMKVNFPPIFGVFFKEILEKILKGETKENTINKIKTFKESILNGEIPLSELGNPTAVKKLVKYSGRKPRIGEMFTEIKKKAPAPVKAAIKYNDLLKFWGLNKTSSFINKYDKIKWIYLKSNPYKIEALGFIPNEIPIKMQEFLEKYADRKQIFETILLSKLENFFLDLDWEMDLNPHLDAFESFEI